HPCASLERLLERGDLGTCGPDLGLGSLREHTDAAGVGVVVDDQRTVGAAVEVGPDPVGTEGAGSHERFHRVLGRHPGGTPMGEHARGRHRQPPRTGRSRENCPLRALGTVNTLRYCLEVGSPRMLVNVRTNSRVQLARRPRVPEASWRSLGSELMTGTWTRGAVALRAAIPTLTSSSPSGAPALPSSRSRLPDASAPPAT